MGRNSKTKPRPTKGEAAVADENNGIAKNAQTAGDGMTTSSMGKQLQVERQDDTRRSSSSDQIKDDLKNMPNDTNATDKGSWNCMMTCPTTDGTAGAQSAEVTTNVQILDDKHHLQWKGCGTPTVVHNYEQQGANMTTHAFTTLNQRLRLTFYHWKTTAMPGGVETPAKGALVVLHGITGHARFDWLNHRPNLSADSEIDNAKGAHGKEYLYERERYGARREMCYNGSFVEAVNKAGLDVYGIDLQSHGMSDGHKGWRCNVRQFDDVAIDVLQFMHIVNDRLNGPAGSRQPSDGGGTPLFLAGLSMGGCLVVRTAELLEVDLRSIHTGVPPSDLLVPDSDPIDLSANWRGCILLAPMLCLDTVRSQPVNRILQPFAGLAKWLLPDTPVSPLTGNPIFPHLDEDRQQDALTYKGNIKAAIASESLAAVDVAMGDAWKIGRPSPISTNPTGSGDVFSLPRGRPMSFLVFHSRNDTMCDAAGSEQLLEKMVHVTDKELVHPDHLWHCLSFEPGNDQVLAKTATWLTERARVENCLST